MSTTKTAIDPVDWVKRTLAPVSNNVRNTWQLFPHPSSDDFSNRVGEVVSAQDELDKQKKEEETPFWKRMIQNSVIGAGLGGTLASIKAVPLVHKFSPEAAALGAGIGLAGSGGLTLARHVLQGPLKRRAEETISNADPGVRFVSQSPKTREKSREWEDAQWSPVSFAETGGLAGGLGGAAALWAAGRSPMADGAWKYTLGGAAAGGVLGHLLGRWHKNVKHKEFLDHVNQELSGVQHPRAQEASLQAEVEQQPMNKAAMTQDIMGDILKEAASMTGRGGSPVVSTNAGLMRGRGGKVEQFVARKGGLTKLNQASLDMALDRAVGVYGLAEFCSELEKLADDAQSVQNSDPNGDGPTDEQNSRDAAMVGAHIPVEKDKAPKGTTEPSQISDASTKPSPSQAASTDPSPNVKVSEETPKTLRRRAEAIVSNGKGVLAIKKPGYLLLPGGGVKQDETPEEAVRRETSEETGRRLSYLSRKRPTIDTIFNPDKPCSPGHLGESTDFFYALDGGSDKTDHKDREDFTFIPFDEAISYLLKCMRRDDADWAHANNSTRLFLITQARDESDGTRDDIDGAELAFDKEASLKKADAVQLLPKQEAIAFTPSGNLVARKTKNRRLELPAGLPGMTAVPYENPVSYVPEEGVPEPGYHGHSVSLVTGESPPIEGFDEMSPDAALKELYASLGHPKNRQLQNVDRARARAIIRLMKTRTPVAR